MKLTVVENQKLDKFDLVLECYKVNESIEKIRNYIETFDEKIIAKDNEDTYQISLEDIYYIESIDKKTFVYLDSKVLETSIKLYEIEEKYKDTTLFRAGKSIIVNMKYIELVSPMLNRNLLVTLENLEKIIISRRFVRAFNEKLEMGVSL